MDAVRLWWDRLAGRAANAEEWAADGKGGLQYREGYSTPLYALPTIRFCLGYVWEHPQ